jgi:hypothetical protein
MKTFVPVNLGIVLLRLASQLSVTFTHNWTGLGSSALRLLSITLLPTSGLLDNQERLRFSEQVADPQRNLTTWIALHKPTYRDLAHF